jgi:formylmethanofuran dehydrogenase subunit C
VSPFAPRKYRTFAERKATIHPVAHYHRLRLVYATCRGIGHKIGRSAKLGGAFHHRNRIRRIALLTFTSRITDSLPLEVPGLVPSQVAGKSLAEIERLPVLHGNRNLPLAEFFRVTGRADDKILRFAGKLSSVHHLGERMDGGTIHVDGSTGRHLGAQMTAGEIVVEGNASDFAGCEMQGGTIRILGNAADAVGSAYPGSAQGMRGGSILVHGNIGDEAAGCMRRGLLAVGGSAGSFLAADMLAGSVLVFGDCGPRVGANMRRGTIALFGYAPSMLLTFRPGLRGPSLILRMLLVQLQRGGFPLPAELLGANYEVFHGDFLSLGRGEVFVRT